MECDPILLFLFLTDLRFFLLLSSGVNGNNKIFFSFLPTPTWADISFVTSQYQSLPLSPYHCLAVHQLLHLQGWGHLLTNPDSPEPCSGASVETLCPQSTEDFLFISSLCLIYYLAMHTSLPSSFLPLHQCGNSSNERGNAFVYFSGALLMWHRVWLIK